jgi:hypothetical protein
MRCKKCGEFTGFIFGQTECKACQKERMDRWVKEHSFIFNEKVAITPTQFHPEVRTGIVIDKGEDVSGAWGYYDTTEWYMVKMDATGDVIKFSPEQLEKVREGK